MINLSIATWESLVRGAEAALSVRKREFENAVTPAFKQICKDEVLLAEIALEAAKKGLSQARGLRRH